MNNVRVRIAPSPTGIPHIGNTRTALFNFLFAKHNNGAFILRIEDTDQKRIVEGARAAISEILDWLSLTIDETYTQSERLDIYKEHVKMLLDKNVAYEQEGAVWVKVPKGKKISWADAIGNKHIVFNSDVVEDFVVLKSDGFPTYHLASVVDDSLMKISHVIRGEEWISSTPKHLFLYESFGFTPPVFAHLPVILGPDKSKLSKRHGAESVLDYRVKGYLKEALLNFMVLLGWNPGENKEIMTLDEMIQLFDLKDVNTASPVFDIKKLDWMNGEYIRKSNTSQLADQIYDFYDKKYSLEIIENTIPLVYERMKTLADYLPLCEFFFTDVKTYEIDLSGKKDMLKEVTAVLSSLKTWDKEHIDNKLQDLAKKLNLSNSEFFMILRVAITGKKISPPLSESMVLLGKEKVIKKLESVITSP